MNKIDIPTFKAETSDQLHEFVDIFSAYPDFVPNYIKIDFRHFEVSRDVFHALGNMLAQRSSPIKSIYFDLSFIEHDGVLILLRAFLENPIATPKSIYITGDLVQGVSLGNLHLVLGPLLQSRLCSLEQLSLWRGKRWVGSMTGKWYESSSWSSWSSWWAKFGRRGGPDGVVLLRRDHCCRRCERGSSRWVGMGWDGMGWDGMECVRAV